MLDGSEFQIHPGSDHIHVEIVRVQGASIERERFAYIVDAVPSEQVEEVEALFYSPAADSAY